MAQIKEAPVFATANSVINSEPSVQDPKAKTNKTKEKQPTTGEKGEVAEHKEKTHRETVSGVFESAHSARIPSGNTGQLKSRAQLPVPEQKALV